MIYGMRATATAIMGPGAPIWLVTNAAAAGGVTPPVSAASDYIPVWRPRRR